LYDSYFAELYYNQGWNKIYFTPDFIIIKIYLYIKYLTLMQKLQYLAIIMLCMLCISCNSKQKQQRFFANAETDTMQFVNVISPDADSISSIDMVDLDTDNPEKSIKDEDPYKSETKTELMTIDEQVNYWKEFRKYLLKKDYNKLADMVQYPLFGDVFRFKIYAPDYTDEQVAMAQSKDGKFYREDFVKHASKIFDKEFLQLLSKYDFDKAVKNEEYKPTLKTADGYIHSIYIFTGDEDRDPDEYSSYYHLSYGSEDPRESITQSSEIYYIRKNKEGKILLFCINGAG